VPPASTALDSTNFAFGYGGGNPMVAEAHHDRHPPTYPAHHDHSCLPWYVLELWRTKWYDLFVANDRVEIMRGLWGVLAWLMRSSQPEPTASGFSATVP
jgi:hypothetical protein